MKKIYYLKMLRIEDWIKGYFWIPIIGVILISPSFKNLFLVGIIFFFATGYAFAVNNYFDAEIDKKHKEKVKLGINPLANNIINKKNVLRLLIFLALTPLILSIMISFNGFILVFLSLFISTLYSMSRIRLKERPGLDIISHGLMFGFFPFLAGVVLAGGTFDILMILIALLFFIMLINGLLMHQIIDYHYDFRHTNNFTLKIGREISVLFFLLFSGLAILCLQIISNFFFLEAWLFYVIAIFLVSCYPLSYINKIKEELVKKYY